MNCIGRKKTCSASLRRASVVAFLLKIFFLYCSMLLSWSGLCSIVQICFIALALALTSSSEKSNSSVAKAMVWVKNRESKFKSETSQSQNSFGSAHPLISIKGEVSYLLTGAQIPNCSFDPSFSSEIGFDETYRA